MMRVNVSLKEIRSNVKDARNLLKRTWMQLLTFELIYAAIAYFVMLPICRIGFSVVADHAHLGFIAFSNILQILTTPSVLIVLILEGFLVTIYTFCEIAGLVILYNHALQGRELSVLDMFRLALRQGIRALDPRSWRMMLFGLCMIPVSRFFCTGLVGNLRLPVFVGAEAHPPLSYLYYGTNTVLILLVIVFALSFHVFFLEEKSKKNPFVEAVRVTKGRYLTLALSWLYMMVATVLTYFAVAIALITISFGFTMMMSGTDVVSAAVYSLTKQWAYVLSNVGKPVMVVTTYAVTMVCFTKFRAEKGREPLPVKEESPRAKRTNKRALVPVALFLMTAIALVNLNVGMNVMEGKELGARQDMVVAAHRGDAVSAPENTIPAIRNAISAGADYAEIDVQLTSDGAVVLTHDANLKRMTGVDVDIADITLAEAQKLDASGPFIRSAGTPIPTLEEVLKVSKGHIKLLVELKPNDTNREQLAKSTVEVIRQMDALDECVIHSLDYESLEIVKRLEPGLKCGFCTPFIKGDLANLDAADFLTVEQTYLSRYQISQAESEGKEIWAWTVDDEGDVLRMCQLNVAGIISNDPAMCRETLQIDRITDRIIRDALGASE